MLTILLKSKKSSKSVVEAEPKPSKAATHHRAADQLANSGAQQALEKELARDKSRAEHSIAVKQESTELEPEFRLFPELELSAEQRRSETALSSPERPLFPFVSRPSVSEPHETRLLETPSDSSMDPDIGSILIPGAFEDTEHEYASKSSGELADLSASFRQFTFGSPKHSAAHTHPSSPDIDPNPPSSVTLSSHSPSPKLLESMAPDFDPYGKNAPKWNSQGSEVAFWLDSLEGLFKYHKIVDDKMKVDFAVLEVTKNREGG
ncbi:hypothetical protein BDQ17DRAFT_1426583 [Cyathus striatus]|nr:hypothetical protein BDQ17DRAFT_1426583 [Cyathus striatus]